MAKTAKIAILTRPSLDRVVDGFMKPGIPVIIRGALGWPAFTKWTHAYLRKQLGRLTVSVQGGATGGPRVMTVAELIARLLDHAGEPIYLEDIPFAGEWAALRSDFSTPAYFASDVIQELAPAAHPQMQWLCWGGKGSSTPRHRDRWGSSAWNVTVSGTKEWALGDLHGAPSFIGRTQPGDLLYTPPLMAYAVTNLSESLSVTGNFIAPRDLRTAERAMRDSGDPPPAFYDLIRKKLGMKPRTRRYRLIPEVVVGQIGSRHWVHDAAVTESPIIRIPTQRITREMFDVLRAIRDAGSKRGGEPWTLAELRGLCSTPRQVSRIDKLVEAGHLELVDEPVRPRAPGAHVPGAEAAPAHEVDRYFRERQLRHYFRANTFFNVPAVADDETVDVGIMGVPVSTVPASLGVEAAPSMLRAASQYALSWLASCEKGIYSEIGVSGWPPRRLCQGVRLGDFGDVDSAGKTIGALFDNVGSAVMRLLERKARPLFVGGDHAITFPIVHALRGAYPNIHLIHLDAHNDLFYGHHVDFSHASPIRGLLAHSGLERVYSFGLRTNSAGNAWANVEALEAQVSDLPGRVRLFSLQATKDLLATREQLRAVLAESRGHPCYVSIDLDVLSAAAMSGQLSTPHGHGLEHHELLALLDEVFSQLHVVGADVVELNAGNKTSGPSAIGDVLCLLLFLIDRLAATSSPAQRSSRSPRSS